MQPSVEPKSLVSLYVDKSNRYMAHDVAALSVKAHISSLYSCSLDGKVGGIPRRPKQRGQCENGKHGCELWIE